MAEIILASASPRRRDLLQRMGVTFKVLPSNFEEWLDDGQSPTAVAQKLALGKAREVASHHPNAYVIGADTIVTIHGRQLGKPRDLDEAHELLRQLCGHTHEVTTGIALLQRSRAVELVGADTTHVQFKPYNAADVAAYLATKDSLDKAVYGIQSGAAPLIDHIRGQYDTVIGLPTHLLATFFKQVGIPARAVSPTPPVSQIPL